MGLARSSEFLSAELATLLVLRFLFGLGSGPTFEVFVPWVCSINKLLERSSLDLLLPFRVQLHQRRHLQSCPCR